MRHGLVAELEAVEGSSSSQQEEEEEESSENTLDDEVNSEVFVQIVLVAEVLSDSVVCGVSKLNI